METLRAFIYAIGVFAALVIISLIVALIMQIMYKSVHRKEKVQDADKKAETGVVSQ
jgi:hypothetical protein